MRSDAPFGSDSDLWARLPAALYRTTADGRILAVNDEFVTLFGYPSSDALLRTPAQALYVDPHDRERCRSQIELDGRVSGFEEQLQKADGTVFWACTTMRVIRDGSGATMWYEGIVEDITVRRKAEEELRQSQRLLAEAQQVSGVGSWSWDISTNKVTWSKQLYRIYGLAPSDFAATFEAYIHRVHPADRDRARAAVERALADRAAFSLQERVLRADGEIRWVQSNGEVLLDDAGQPVRMVGACLDITETKRGYEEQARLSQAVEHAAESVVITDPQWKIVYTNPAFESISGYTREDAIGRTPRSLLSSGDRDEVFYRALSDKLARGESWKGRFINRRKDGKLFEEDATISPVRDATAQIVNYVAVKRDVSAEQLLERQLAGARKMEAVGRLAGGIAHDFNNLLGVITGYSELVLRRVQADAALRGKVEQILKAANSAAGLTQQLLAFSRRQVLQPKVLDLGVMVNDMEQMLRRVLREDIDLVIRLEPDLGRIRADPGQIEQVIMNLVVNARDAMPAEGELTIEIQNAELEAGHLEAPFTVVEGRYVLLSVTDTGCGMDAETQAHIFEPFFTTKPQSKGTGLGLATVYGIVKQSEGYIWASSELDVGTTIKMYLPRVDEQADPLNPLPVTPPVGGIETVLLVEDEPSLREVIAEALRVNGYTVLVARDGAEALQVADTHPGAIELTLTDVIMPGMAGPDAAEQIARARPAMKVLYMSGYSDVAIARHGVLSPGTAFIEKPFATGALLHKLRGLLDNS
jgi:two-component system cell cycle sensor histidine kinase/response regulator CckA